MHLQKNEKIFLVIACFQIWNVTGNNELQAVVRINELLTSAKRTKLALAVL
jgi:hypothetical protein